MRQRNSVEQAFFLFPGQASRSDLFKTVSKTLPYCLRPVQNTCVDPEMIPHTFRSVWHKFTIEVHHIILSDRQLSLRGGAQIAGTERRLQQPSILCYLTHLHTDNPAESTNQNQALFRSFMNKPHLRLSSHTTAFL